MSRQISARCPVTGEPVVTDIACDSESLTRISFLVATEACPACGAPHTWKKSEAFLAEAKARAAAA
jgi:endogenous inhibitor of DNA gyrase (YacG/DUF329 family)